MYRQRPCWCSRLFSGAGLLDPKTDRHPNSDRASPGWAVATAGRAPERYASSRQDHRRERAPSREGQGSRRHQTPSQSAPPQCDDWFAFSACGGRGSIACRRSLVTRRLRVALRLTKSERPKLRVPTPFLFNQRHPGAPPRRRGSPGPPAHGYRWPLAGNAPNHRRTGNWPRPRGSCTAADRSCS